MRAILKSFNFNFKLLKVTYGKRYDDQRNIFSRNPRKINIAPKSPICPHPYHILKICHPFNRFLNQHESGMGMGRPRSPRGFESQGHESQRVSVPGRPNDLGPSPKRPRAFSPCPSPWDRSKVVSQSQSQSHESQRCFS